jgi:hypothetical protein
MLATIGFLVRAGRGVRGVPGALAALLTTLSVAAQTPGLRESQPTGALPPGGTGLIAGQVVSPDTGLPVGEALVTLRLNALTGPESPRVLTDAQGRFVFVNVPAARYYLDARKLGYATGLFGQRTPGTSSGDFDIILGDSQILTDLTVPLWKHAAIGGTVTDEAGQPVVGVRVDAFRKTIEFGDVWLPPHHPTSNGGATTDDRGLYRLSDLPPGEYAVGVLTTYTTFPAEVMPETQGTGALRSRAFFVSHEIVGPLGHARNQQVGEYVLIAGGRTALPPAPAESDVTSVYRTTFSPGTPLPADATSITVRSGEERSGMNITLKPSRASRVSGRLIGPDGPVAHAGVSLLANGKGQAGYPSSYIGATATAMTDAAGNFTILGVPDGDYIIDTNTGGRFADFLYTAEVITVAGADITDLTLTGRRAGRMIGRFDLHGDKPPTVGHLEVFGQHLTLGIMSLGLTAQRSDPTFTSYVPPGPYALTLPAYSDLLCTAVLVAGRDLSDGVFVMGTDDVVDVTVQCNNPTTRLSGTVRDERGRADPAAAVVVFPAERQFWSGSSLRARRFQRVFSDKSGAFAVRALPPGEYFVAAIPEQTSDVWQDRKRLETLARSATRVTVGPAESRTVELRTVQIK